MSKSALIVLSVMFFLLSCRNVAKNVTYMGGNTTSGKTPITYGTATGYVPKQGDIGKKKTCPVNGQPVVVKQDTPAVSFKGQVFYFCCTACMQEFERNPEKYLK